MDAEARSEYWATLALRHAQGIGPRSWTRLLKTFGSAYAAMQHLPQWGDAGISAEKKAQVASGSWRTTARQEWDAVQSLDANIILWHDDLYPKLLRELPDAPALLYCAGDVSLLRAPAVAVVGSRHCTVEGGRVAASIAQNLAACGITIVSGMAQGIDTAAHQVALQQVGKSIAVLGTGIDIVYPRSNTAIRERMLREGLLVTEFAPGVEPSPGNFPVRNRIISGLSLGVLVVEAALRSGSLITARLALEQNREVYAVPGAVFAKHSQGCQELIRQGARATFAAEDILCDLAVPLADYGIQQSALAPELREIALADIPAGGLESSIVYSEDSTAQFTSKIVPPVPASPLPEGDAGRILAHLRQKGECHVDTLCMELQLSPGPLNALLIELEIAHRVTRLPGARYCESIHAS